MSTARDNRRKLQVLQTNDLANQSRLVGNDGFVRINRKKSKTDGRTDNSCSLSKENFTACGEPDTPSSTKSESTCDHSLIGDLDAKPAPTNTTTSSSDGVVQVNGCQSQSSAPIDTSADEIINWMTAAEPPNGYWKELAEQRGIALADALTENEEVWERLEIAEKEIETLKAEKELLKEAADEAQILAKLLQELIDDSQNEEQQ